MQYLNSKILYRCCVVILSFLVIGSCSDNSMPYQTSSALSEKLLEISKQGPQDALQRLDEVTDFSWDTVYYFGEGSLKTVVNETSGAAVFKNDSGRYHGHGGVLVFKHGKDLAGVFAIVPPLLISGTDKKAYSIKDAVLIAHTKDPGPYLLRFVD